MKARNSFFLKKRSANSVFGRNQRKNSMKYNKNSRSNSFFSPDVVYLREKERISAL